MSLSDYKVAAGFAVSDLGRARRFYEGKLGLSVGIDSGDNVQYRCGEGSVIHVYLSPEHAGKTTAALAGWYVDNIESVMDKMAERGVVFERYDEPHVKTDEKGIAAFEVGAKVAYFKDPDGNTLSVAQAPRSVGGTSRDTGSKDTAGTNPVAELDPGFSSPDATVSPWPVAREILERTEVYWLATVRFDGRPHVTPLIAVWVDGALYFSTGPDERKAKNLAENSRCVITTGSNTLSGGLDVVVEGEAIRVSDEARLRLIADTFASKYGTDTWHFTVRDGAFHHEGGGGKALVFEVAPTQAFGFGRGGSFSQTRWRFQRRDEGQLTRTESR